MTLPTVKVEFAFGNTPNDASPTWTEVVSTDMSAMSFTAKRGRSFELDQFQPGTATVVLDNSDGRYTPPGSSPYADQVLLMTPVRIRAVWSAVTYELWRGYIERIQVTWQPGGIYGTAEVQAVDLIALLANVSQDLGALGYAVVEDGAVGFWPLDEPAGATTGRQLANSDAQLATIRRANTNSLDPTFGQAIDGLIGAGSSPAGVKFNGFGTTYQAGACLIADLGGTSVITGEFTVGMWTVTPTVTLGSGQEMCLANLYNSSSPSASAHLGLSFVLSNTLRAVSWGDVTYETEYFTSILDGNLHYILMTYDSSSVIHLYVDGVEVSSITDSHSPYTVDAIAIGGRVLSTGAQNFYAGTIAGVELYDTALSASQVLDHYQAGLLAFAGETTGDRVTRLLGYSNYPVTTAIDTGSTDMAAASLAGQTLQAGIQDAVSTERGRFFVAGDGTVTMLGRAAEYNQTPVATFGDDTGVGEIPYAALEFSYDPEYLFNDITVTCPSGSARVVDNDSITQYGRRSTSITIEAANDTEARSLAQYLLVRFRQPQLRVASVTLQPDRTDGLWPTVLALEIGDVITVNRRPDGSPALTGQDYVIESVSHTSDGQSATWSTTVELSPLLSGVHYWTLEDPTYGQIDVPTILISA